MRLRALAVALAAVVLCSDLPGQSLSGRRAPGFSLPDAAFAQHDVYDYRGRWLLLVFVKTDSDNSKALSRLLESRKIQWGAKAAVLSVAITPPDNQATISKYTADTRITTPIVFDQGQAAASYFRATPTRPRIDLPRLFAINPQGMIVRDWTEVQVGMQTFAAELDALIAGGR